MKRMRMRKKRRAPSRRTLWAARRAAAFYSVYTFLLPKKQSRYWGDVTLPKGTVALFRTVRDLYLTHEQLRTLPLPPSPPPPPPRYYLIYINELVLRGTGARQQRHPASQSRRTGGWRVLRGTRRTAHFCSHLGHPGGDVAAPIGDLLSRPIASLRSPLLGHGIAPFRSCLLVFSGRACPSLSPSHARPCRGFPPGARRQTSARTSRPGVAASTRLSATARRGCAAGGWSWQKNLCKGFSLILAGDEVFTSLCFFVYTVCVRGNRVSPSAKYHRCL